MKKLFNIELLREYYDEEVADLIDMDDDFKNRLDDFKVSSSLKDKNIYNKK